MAILLNLVKKTLSTAHHASDRSSRKVSGALANHFCTPASCNHTYAGSCLFLCQRGIFLFSRKDVH